MDQVFAKILEPRNGFSIREYVQYLQKISDHYHDNIPLNQGSFITLLIEIIKEYMKHASDVPALKEGEIDEEAYKNLTYQYLHE